MLVAAADCVTDPTGYAASSGSCNRFVFFRCAVAVRCLNVETFGRIMKTTASAKPTRIAALSSADRDAPCNGPNVRTRRSCRKPSNNEAKPLLEGGNAWHLHVYCRTSHAQTPYWAILAATARTQGSSRAKVQRQCAAELVCCEILHGFKLPFSRTLPRI